MKPRIEYFHECVLKKEYPIYLHYIKPQIWKFDKDKMKGVKLPSSFGSWKPPHEKVPDCVQKWC